MSLDSYAFFAAPKRAHPLLEDCPIFFVLLPHSPERHRHRQGGRRCKGKIDCFFWKRPFTEKPDQLLGGVSCRTDDSSDQENGNSSFAQSISGPSPSEREAGYRSIFSLTTSNLLKELRIRGATAYVDLIDFRQTLPGASSSCGSAEFQSQISHTLHQFPKVKRVIYAINGDPRTFYAWMGEPCDKTNGYCDPRPFGSPRKQAHSP